MKSKDKAPDLILDYLVWMKHQTNLEVKTFMADGGREFVNKKVKNALKEREAEFLVSCPETPSQNGIAEKNNQTIQKLARTMLLAANCDYRLWGEACLTAVFLLNITNECPDTGKTAFEMIYGSPPNLKILHPLGSRCYYYNHNFKKSRWKSRAISGILVGYTESIDGYRIWNPEEQKLYKRKDVCFLRQQTLSPTITPRDSDFSLQTSPNSQNSDEDVHSIQEQDEEER